MLPADRLQLEEPRGVLHNAPTLSVWPALRSTILLLASFGLVLIGTLSLLGPSNSLSDRALRRACYALDDHLIVASCSAPFAVPGGVDLDVVVAFLLAGVMGVLFFLSVQGYWRLYASAAGDVIGRVFRG
jgi:hypothetical protein